MCVCVCVCVFSSHPFWTSSSLDVPAGVTQEEGHTGFLTHLPSAVRALVFPARRIQPFLSLVDREVEFCLRRPFPNVQIEYVRRTDPILGPNDHIGKCGVIRPSHLRVIFNTYTLVRAAAA